MDGKGCMCLVTGKAEISFCLYILVSWLPVMYITFWLNAYLTIKLFCLLALWRGFLGWQICFQFYFSNSTNHQPDWHNERRWICIWSVIPQWWKQSEAGQGFHQGSFTGRTLHSWGEGESTWPWKTSIFHLQVGYFCPLHFCLPWLLPPGLSISLKNLAYY